MAKEKFGKKRLCPNCTTKFYDMLKEPPLRCPHCNEEVEILTPHLSDYFLQDSKRKQNEKSTSEEISVKDNVSSEEIETENDDIISLEEVDDEEDSN